MAVAAIIAGWALAQSPLFLPGLTIEAAAAPRTTLIAVTVAVLGGAVISFRHSRCCSGLTSPAVSPKAAKASTSARRPGWSGHRDTGSLHGTALACLIAGIGLLTAAEAAWAHALGVVSLFGFVALGFPAALPPDVVSTGERREAALTATRTAWDTRRTAGRTTTPTQVIVSEYAREAGDLTRCVLRPPKDASHAGEGATPSSCRCYPGLASLAGADANRQRPKS